MGEILNGLSQFVRSPLYVHFAIGWSAASLFLGLLLLSAAAWRGDDC